MRDDVWLVYAMLMIVFIASLLLDSMWLMMNAAVGFVAGCYLAVIVNRLRRRRTM